MRISSICSALLVSFVALAVAAPAQAVPVPLFTFTSTVTVGTGNFHIGNEIQISDEPLDVFAMGAFIGPAQRAGGVTTAEYNSYLYASDATTLLSSTVIPIGTPVDAQGFAYIPVDYQLSPSTHYYLTSRQTGGSTSFGYNSAGTGNNAGTWAFDTNFIRNRYASGSGTVTTTNGSFEEFMGGNLLVDLVPTPPVPEPATGLLLGAGLFGLSQLRRRRNRGSQRA